MLKTVVRRRRIRATALRAAAFDLMTHMKEGARGQPHQPTGTTPPERKAEKREEQRAATSSDEARGGRVAKIQCCGAGYAGYAEARAEATAPSISERSRGRRRGGGVSSYQIGSYET